MKRVLICLVAITSTLAMAGICAADQSNTGCGLGTMVFPNADSILTEILAVTTNGTSGNQTFGITSGTSNCKRPGSFASNQKLNQFVAANMDNVARDIARGEGEYLDTLVVLMEIPTEEKATFCHTLQKNFTRIYTSETVTHDDVLNNIEAIRKAG
jgi:hypothetical protein